MELCGNSSRKGSCGAGRSIVPCGRRKRRRAAL